jgi:hypothetical protein
MLTVAEPYFTAAAAHELRLRSSTTGAPLHSVSLLLPLLCTACDVLQIYGLLIIYAARQASKVLPALMAYGVVLPSERLSEGVVCGEGILPF